MLCFLHMLATLPHFKLTTQSEADCQAFEKDYCATANW